MGKISRALTLGQSYDAYVLASRELRQELHPSLLTSYAQAIFAQGQREEALIATLFTLSLFPAESGARLLLGQSKNPTPHDTQKATAFAD